MRNAHILNGIALIVGTFLIIHIVSNDGFLPQGVSAPASKELQDRLAYAYSPLPSHSPRAVMLSPPIAQRRRTEPFAEYWAYHQRKGQTKGINSFMEENRRIMQTSYVPASIPDSEGWEVIFIGTPGAEGGMPPAAKPFIELVNATEQNVISARILLLNDYLYASGRFYDLYYASAYPEGTAHYIDPNHFDLRQANLWLHSYRYDSYQWESNRLATETTEFNENLNYMQRHNNTVWVINPEGELVWSSAWPDANTPQPGGFKSIGWQVPDTSFAYIVGVTEPLLHQAGIGPGSEELEEIAANYDVFEVGRTSVRIEPHFLHNFWSGFDELLTVMFEEAFPQAIAHTLSIIPEAQKRASEVWERALDKTREQ